MTPAVLVSGLCCFLATLGDGQLDRARGNASRTSKRSSAETIDEGAAKAEVVVRTLVGVAGALGRVGDLAKYPYAAGRATGMRAAERPAPEPPPTAAPPPAAAPATAVIDPFETAAPPAAPSTSSPAAPSAAPARSLAPHASAGRTPGVSMRASLDGAWQYSGLWRGRLGFALDTAARIGVAGHLNVWGNPSRRDHMLLGDLRLHVLLGNWRHAMLRTGAGFDVLHAPSGYTAFGGDWNLSGEIFPVRPLVLSFDVGVGGIGGAVYVTGRATIGVAIRRVEVFGGYEHKLVGLPGIGGPLLGARVWF